MRVCRNALLCLAAAAALVFAADAASAQQVFSRGPAKNVGVKGPVRGATQNIGVRGPTRGGYRGGGNYGGGGFRGGWGVPGVLMGIPQMIPPDGGQYVDDGGNGPRGREPAAALGAAAQQQCAAGQRTALVPDEVVIEIANTVSPAQIDALQSRFRLTRLESQTFQLSGTTLYRWRIPGNVSVPRWCGRWKPTRVRRGAAELSVHDAG